METARDIVGDGASMLLVAADARRRNRQQACELIDSKDLDEVRPFRGSGIHAASPVITWAKCLGGSLATRSVRKARSTAMICDALARPRVRADPPTRPP